MMRRRFPQIADGPLNAGTTVATTQLTGKVDPTTQVCNAGAQMHCVLGAVAYLLC
jgi:hypothetical protein